MTTMTAGPGKVPLPPADPSAPGPLLDLWAKIGISLDTVASEMAAQRQREAAAFESVSFRPVQPVSFTGSQAPVISPIAVPTGWTWAVQRITCSNLGAGTGSSSAASWATGAITTGAGTATLAAGAAATGFTLSFSAAPSATGTATLSNVVGGPFVYDIPSGQTSPYTVTFPAPIAASGGAATLTVAGLGTGAGQIVLYGQSTTAGTSADLMAVYRGAAAPSSAVPQNQIGVLSSGSPTLHLGRTGILLKASQSLIFGGALTSATLYVVNIDVIPVSDVALPAFLM